MGKEPKTEVVHSKDLWGDKTTIYVDGKEVAHTGTHTDAWTGKQVIDTVDNRGHKISETKSEKNDWSENVQRTYDPRGHLISETRTENDGVPLIFFDQPTKQTVYQDGNPIAEVRTYNDGFGRKDVVTRTTKKDYDPARRGVRRPGSLDNNTSPNLHEYDANSGTSSWTNGRSREMSLGSALVKIVIGGSIAFGAYEFLPSTRAGRTFDHGMEHLSKHEYVEAVKDFDKVGEIDHEHPSSRLEERFLDGVEGIMEFVELSCGSDRLLNQIRGPAPFYVGKALYGLLEETKGKIGKSQLKGTLKSLDFYLEHKPDDLEATLYKTEVLTKKGKNLEALTEANKILIKEPNNISALRFAGFNLAEKHNYSEAIKAYDRVLQLKPGDQWTIEAKKQAIGESDDATKSGDLFWKDFRYNLILMAGIGALVLLPYYFLRD